jgi:hypothetical protein
MGADWWDKMFKDHGYNASPVWNMFGSRFANMSPPATSRSVTSRCWISSSTVTMFLAILWAFGLRAFALALVVLGVGYPWAYYWTGGAFARVAWLWDAVLGVCFLKRRWYFLGGAAVMGAALDRAFPSVIFVGVGIAMVIQFVKHLRGAVSRRPPRAKVRASSRAACTLDGRPRRGRRPVRRRAPERGDERRHEELVGVLGQLTEAPQNALTNHMGLPTLWTYHPAHVARKSKNDKMEDPFQGWKDKRQDLLHQNARRCGG